MEFKCATLLDLEQLHQLEQQAFSEDRLTKRQLRRFINSKTDYLLTAQHNDKVVAYALIIFNQATQIARLYSIAVDKEFKNQGIATNLLTQCEVYAVEKGYITMRLEVREDNTDAIALYRKLGFTKLRILIHYYDDLADGIRMQKRLGTPGPSKKLPMPLYVQTLPFTCGAACLLMSFAALGHPVKPSRTKEVQLWREATTIFMAGGHGGCSGQGLALAAHRRGFEVELWSHSPDTPFIHSVRNVTKKEVIKLVHDDFVQKITATDISVHEQSPDVSTIENRLAEGVCILLLISTYRFNGYKEPHWIVLSGMNKDFFFFHDPFVENQENVVDAAFIPVAKVVLSQIVGFGKQKHTACVMIKNRPEIVTE
ncbi:MAG: ribosomal protein S18-alanine N-acetyltransferase [Vibrionaceae bacterium]